MQYMNNIHKCRITFIYVFLEIYYQKYKKVVPLNKKEIQNKIGVIDIYFFCNKFDLLGYIEILMFKKINNLFLHSLHDLYENIIYLQPLF